MPDLPGLSWMLLGWLSAVVLVLFVFGLVAYPRLAQWHQKKDNPIGFLLAAVAFVAVFFAVLAIVIDIPKENLGKPATSLEPGTYRIYAVYEDTGSGTFSVLLSERSGTDEKGLPLFGEARFLQLDITKLNNVPRVGIASIRLLTECGDNACVTQYKFVICAPNDPCWPY